MWLNDEFIGITPHIIHEKPSGTYKLRLELPDYVSNEATLVIQKGKETIHHRELASNWGKISISSSPTGATVYLDDVLVTDKTTPCVLDRVAPGVHVVKFFLAGHSEGTARTSVIRGKTASVAAKLEPMRGRLVVSSSYGGGSKCEGNLKIDGQIVGRTPWQGDVSAGSHTVEVQCQNGKASQQVTVANNGRSDVNIKIETSYDSFFPGIYNTNFPGYFSYASRYWAPIVSLGQDRMLYYKYYKYRVNLSMGLASLSTCPLTFDQGNDFWDETSIFLAATVGLDGRAYVAGIVASDSKDPLLFDRFDFSTGTHTRTTKRWFPTGAFSDCEVGVVRVTDDGVVYIGTEWRYISWAKEQEDIYFAKSSDNMATWSSWIQAAHVGSEGTVLSSRSAVVDKNKTMWVALTTTWDGGSAVVVAFNGTAVTHREAVHRGPAVTKGHVGAVIFLNRDSGRLAFLYLDEQGRPSVRYNSANNYSSWSSPQVVAPKLVGGINVNGNSEVYGPMDRDRYYAVWNSESEMFLLQWDGVNSWEFSPVPKVREQDLYDGRVQVLSDGQPLVIQSYTTGDTADGFIVNLMHPSCD
ncbi:MAG: PEGA domain protein [Deltaproteobacteria bacterium ADurb.Bin058]|nr:MAG: PEGA domain protein [Deltaproteobacteria bacterium ADurb.Bin058]